MHFAVPGPVSNVRAVPVSDEAVLINWSAPEEVNGILQHYILVYMEYDSLSTAVELIVFPADTSLGISGLCELLILAYSLLTTMHPMHCTLIYTAVVLYTYQYVYI